MTTKQKTAIAIGSGILGAYAAVFIYQRIQRAKADASELSSEEALKILQRLGKLPEEKVQLFETHKKNYKDIGLHEWYSNMTKLYK